jgi:serine/threonine protein kinase
VLLDAEGYVKITDFGLSKENMIENSAFSFCGTPEYLAPEIIKKAGHGKAVDWWSLGTLIFEMLTGLPPFYTKDRERLFNNIQFSDIKYPDYLSPSARNLISGLLVKDPDLRLGSGASGSQSIKQHSWFGGLDWSALLNKSIPAPFVPTLSGNMTNNFEPEFTKKPAVDSAKREAKLAGSLTYEDFSFVGGGFDLGK